jgi:hypothetical protein
MQGFDQRHGGFDHRQPLFVVDSPTPAQSVAAKSQHFW